MKKFLLQLSFLFRPRYWIRVDPYSAAWDRALNRMLDNPTFTDIGTHAVKLNGKTIWTANYPYGFGAPYGWGPEVLPSRATVVRLRDALEKAIFFEEPK